MLSPDARCKTFDESANGYARGEGCSGVALKLLSTALTDGNRVLAVIKGAAVNQDGRSASLTAPNGPSQEEVIQIALDDAGVSATDVEYIETHGTGTALGDPIEVGALRSVYGAGRSEERPLVLGAVKTNIGHLEACAGTAGLIKVVLSLIHREAAPNLHLKKLNPHLNLSGFPVVFPKERVPLGQWTGSGGRLLAGLSSFGFGGTNAHVIIEEADRAGEGEVVPLVDLISREGEAIFTRQAFPWYIPSSKSEMSSPLYEVDWVVTPLRAGMQSKSALLLGVSPAIASKLRDVLASSVDGLVVTHVADAGIPVNVADGEVSKVEVANLTDKEHVGALLGGKAWDTVVLVVGGSGSVSIGESLALVQSLLSLEAAKRPAQVLLVTQGSLPVSGEPSTESSARQGWVSGLVRCLANEHPELPIRHVDLPHGGEGEAGLTSKLVELVDGQLGMPEHEGQTAIRGDRAYVPRLVTSRVTVSDEARMGVKEEGTYLISGGLGALGLVFARRVIEEGARNLVLLSRNGANTPALESEVAKLQSLGARVEVMKCDVSKLSSVQKMLKDVRGAKLPLVRGIIHSAGVLDDATVENQSVERFERVFSSKVSDDGVSF